MTRLAYVVAAAGIALLTAACVSGGEGDSGGGDGEPVGGADISDELEITRVGETGGVTVHATWLRTEDLTAVDADLSEYPLDRFVLVDIQFTTHSGDLSQIDMTQAAALRQSEADLQPADWISLSDDSHHRAGILVFPRGLELGPVELTIEIGDEQLALHWESVPPT